MNGYQADLSDADTALADLSVLLCLYMDVRRYKV